MHVARTDEDLGILASPCEAMKVKTNGSPSITSKMDDGIGAVPPVKRDLIGERPWMRRAGRTDVSDLQLAFNELTPVSEPLCAVVRQSIPDHVPQQTRIRQFRDVRQHDHREMWDRRTEAHHPLYPRVPAADEKHSGRDHPVIPIPTAVWTVKLRRKRTNGTEIDRGPPEYQMTSGRST